MRKQILLSLLLIAAIGCGNDDGRNKNTVKDTSSDVVDSDPFEWDTEFDTDPTNIPDVSYAPKCYPYKIFNYSIWLGYTTEALAVNNSDIAVGHSYNNDKTASLQNSAFFQTHFNSFSVRNYSSGLNTDFYTDQDFAETLLNTSAVDINEYDVILANVDFRDDSSNKHAAIIRMDGSISLLFEDEEQSMAYDINDNGQVVGVLTERIVDPSIPASWTEYNAYIWQDGTPQYLGAFSQAPDEANARALALNNDGTIVGAAKDSNDVWKPVIWTLVDTTYTDAPLSTLGGTNGEGRAYKISNSGIIVGEADDDQGVSRPIIWTAVDAYQYLDLLTSEPMKSGVALSINADDTVVGYNVPSKNLARTRAFIYKNGEMLDLTDLISPYTDHLITKAYDINDNGLIVGVAYQGAFGPMSVVLIPQNCSDEGAL